MNVYVPANARTLSSRCVPSILASGFPALVFPVEDADSLIDCFSRWWHGTPSRFFSVVAKDIEVITVNDAELGAPYNVLKEFSTCPNRWCISDGCAKYNPHELKINWTTLRKNNDVVKTLSDYPNQKPHYHRNSVVRHA